MDEKTLKRVFSYKIAGLYPMYIQKAEKNGRSKEEVDQLTCWLTGYDKIGLEKQLQSENTLEEFFAQAPKMNPNCHLITGVICGVRVEEVDHPLMQKIRYLDKLVDELAKGKSLEKILRS